MSSQWRGSSVKAFITPNYRTLRACDRLFPWTGPGNVDPDRIPSSVRSGVTVAFERTTVYPPLPSGPRHHPVDQTCSSFGDRTRDREKLPVALLKVASSKVAAPPPKVASMKLAASPKSTSLN